MSIDAAKYVGSVSCVTASFWGHRRQRADLRLDLLVGRGVRLRLRRSLVRLGVLVRRRGPARRGANLQRERMEHPDHRRRGRPVPDVGVVPVCNILRGRRHRRQSPRPSRRALPRRRPATHREGYSGVRVTGDHLPRVPAATPAWARQLATWELKAGITSSSTPRVRSPAGQAPDSRLCPARQVRYHRSNVHDQRLGLHPSLPCRFLPGHPLQSRRLAHRVRSSLLPRDLGETCQDV